MRVVIRREVTAEFEYDAEVCDSKKDDALLEYINDANITAEFSKGDMWYA